MKNIKEMKKGGGFSLYIFILKTLKARYIMLNQQEAIVERVAHAHTSEIRFLNVNPIHDITKLT
jgi:hypothetical protein